jgi:hypothetical protein
MCPTPFFQIDQMILEFLGKWAPIQNQWKAYMYDNIGYLISLPIGPSCPGLGIRTCVDVSTSRRRFVSPFFPMIYFK